MDVSFRDMTAVLQPVGNLQPRDVFTMGRSKYILLGFAPGAGRRAMCLVCGDSQVLLHDVNPKACAEKVGKAIGVQVEYEALPPGEGGSDSSE